MFDFRYLEYPRRTLPREDGLLGEVGMLETKDDRKMIGTLILGCMIVANTGKGIMKENR